MVIIALRMLTRNQLSHLCAYVLLSTHELFPSVILKGLLTVFAFPALILPAVYDEVFKDRGSIAACIRSLYDDIYDRHLPLKSSPWQGSLVR